MSTLVGGRVRRDPLPLGHREREHRAARKAGNLVTVTDPLTRAGAQRWEAAQLAAYRLGHNGRNPRHNRTDHG